MHKIILGSAQFGMDYGINSQNGKLVKGEVFKILKEALGQGIDTVDTAYDYGESEEILGEFIKSYPERLKVISKLPKCSHDDVPRIFNVSLERLNLNSLYGYLIHDFKSYQEDKKIWEELKKLKNQGKIEKIGFSLYYPAELKLIFKDNLQVDLVQIPFSIFDQRFQVYFLELKKRNIAIHCRSVFLQGLAFKDPRDLSSNFRKVKKKLEQLHFLSGEHNIPIFALCFNFVIMHESVDKVLIGIDNISQFEEITKAQGYLEKTKQISSQLLDLRINNEEIILPFRWKLEKSFS